jgi:SpoIID/LytB domain protein
MSSSRRRFLTSLASGIVVSGAAWALPRRVWASDASLAERIDLLYSNQFSFNRKGEPQVSIGVAHGRKKVLLTAAPGLDVLPSGEGGTAISGSSRWEIELLTGKPADQRFAITLASLPASDGRAVDQALKLWKSRGFVVDDVEIGGMFGVKGRVLDTRRVLVTTGSFESENTATAEAATLVDEVGALGRLHPTVRARATGKMRARDLDRDVTVTVEGVAWFVARGGGPITVHGVEHGSTSGPRKVEDRAYHGQIYVAIDRSGGLTVVNVASEVDVLSGLVPAEMYASAPRAALEAQAIAARGQLLGKIGTRHLDDPFLLCADEHCQVYAGTAKEDPRTTAAVRATKGRVLMRPDGSTMVDTVYSANSGGHSEDNDLVWQSPVDPQLRGRPDPLVKGQYDGGIGDAELDAWLREPPKTYSRPKSDAMQGSYRWETTIDPAKLAETLQLPKSFGTPRRVEVVSRGKSGRAMHLRAFGDGSNGGKQAAHELRGELVIRRALGGLRSSMFTVEPELDRFGRFVLLGGGHGHGVGMCQHGAIGMAEAGKSHAHILGHYYASSSLVTLW